MVVEFMAMSLEVLRKIEKELATAAQEQIYFGSAISLNRRHQYRCYHGVAGLAVETAAVATPASRNYQSQ
jgi:hypothetical protein